MLRIQHLLCLGGTSSCYGEVEVCFFRERRMDSLLMGSSNSTFIRSSRRRIVQRLCPSGAGPQAISIFRPAIYFPAGMIGIDISVDF